MRLQHRLERRLVPALHAGLELQERVERLGEGGGGRLVPERQVVAELGHADRQIEVGLRRYRAREGGVEPQHLGGGQARARRDLAHRHRPGAARGEDRLLRHLGTDALHQDGVAEHHLGVAERAGAVGAIQVAVAAQIHRAQVARELRPQEILLARGRAAQAFAVDHRASHVHAARVMFRQRRNEAAVHRAEDREVGGAVGRLRGLVEGFDGGRRQTIEELPVAPQPLAQPQSVGARARRAVQARFEDGLRQPDVGRHAEAFVDEAPLGEERSVAGHVRQKEQPPRGIAEQRTQRRCQAAHHQVAAIVEAQRPRHASERVAQRGVGPHGAAGPVALGREGGNQPAITLAAKRDAAVGNREDVLPERIGRAERLHHRQIGLQPRRRAAVRLGTHAEAGQHTEGERQQQTTTRARPCRHATTWA